MTAAAHPHDVVAVAGAEITDLGGLLGSLRRDGTVHFARGAHTLTYAELERQVWAFVRRARTHGLARGALVGLLCDNGPEFLVALFGLAWLGAASVSLPLPAGLGDAQVGYAERVRRILATAQVDTVIASPMFDANAAAIAGPAVRVLGAAMFAGPGADTAPDDRPALDGHELVFVQYTSGSSAQPKGVGLSHRNILANLHAIVDGARLAPSDRVSSWLPFFHDMGIFGVLASMTAGADVVIYTPWEFIKSPERWLEGFARQRGTVAFAPNFAYEALIAAVPAERVPAYDLRAWRVAFNGAEPIDPVMLERFAEHFAPAGFRPETMFPVYGLAEATLAATFSGLTTAPVVAWVDRAQLADHGVVMPRPPHAPGARGVVSVGRPLHGMGLRIVTPDGRACSDGEVGEVELCGPSVMRGYINAPDSTAAALRDGWLRTGDLGFVVDGELYITGRRKEMIIVRGQNYYPQDVEHAVKQIDGVYRGRCVALAAGTDERMAVVAETAIDEAALPELAEAIQRAVLQRLGLARVDVHLVAKASLKRTTSGKLQRVRMAAELSRGELDRVRMSRLGADS